MGGWEFFLCKLHKKFSTCLPIFVQFAQKFSTFHMWKTFQHVENFSTFQHVENFSFISSSSLRGGRAGIRTKFSTFHMWKTFVHFSQKVINMWKNFCAICTKVFHISTFQHVEKLLYKVTKSFPHVEMLKTFCAICTKIILDVTNFCIFCTKSYQHFNMRKTWDCLYKSFPHVEMLITFGYIV